MDAKNPIQHIARPIQVFMVTLVVLLVIVILEAIAFEVTSLLGPAPALGSREPRKELTAEQEETQRILHAQKEFLPDGTLHLVTEIGARQRQSLDEASPGTPMGRERVYDTNDKLLWEGPAEQCPYHYLLWAWDFGGQRFALYQMRTIRAVSPGTLQTLEFPVATADTLLEMWDYDPWADCFAGYSLETGRLGYLSASGLTDSKSDVRPFGSFQNLRAWWPQDALSPTALWQTEHAIYKIDFAAHQVQAIFESPQSRIEQVTMTPWYIWPNRNGAATESRPLLHCRTSDDVDHLFLKDPDQTITVTPPREWKKWYGNRCEFAATKDAVFLRRTWWEYPAVTPYGNPGWWIEFRQKTRTVWVELYRVDEAGNLALANHYAWTVPAEQDVSPYEAPGSRAKRYVTASSPLLFDLFWLPFPKGFWSEIWQRHESTRVFIEVVTEIRPHYSLWSWLVTATMLALTFWHGYPRRTSLGRLAFWLVFVALLNVAGFLVYWALNHTPTTKCSACGRRRGLNRIDCVHCQASLPTPTHGTLDLISHV